MRAEASVMKKKQQDEDMMWYEDIDKMSVFVSHHVTAVKAVSHFQRAKICRKNSETD